MAEKRVRCNDGISRRFRTSTPYYYHNDKKCPTGATSETECIECGYLFGVHSWKAIVEELKAHVCKPEKPEKVTEMTKLKKCNCPDKDEPSGLMDLEVGRWHCLKCNGYRGKPEKGGRLAQMSDAFKTVKDKGAKCPRCNGGGEVTKKGPLGYEAMVCPVCRGTGKKPKPEQPPWCSHPDGSKCGGPSKMGHNCLTCKNNTVDPRTDDNYEDWSGMLKLADELKDAKK